MVKAIWIPLACIVCGVGFTSAPAAAPIVVGAPITVAQNPPDSREQVEPQVAYDGTGNFLVVWQHRRKFFEDLDPTVLGARISKDGALLDGTPLNLAGVPGAHERPRLAFSNGVFLVVWQDRRGGQDWDVYAARVRPDGTLMDPGGFLVAGGAGSQALPDVAPGPGGFLVVWQDLRNGQFYEIYGARVDAGGAVQDAGGLRLEFAGKGLEGGDPSVARAGSVWFMGYDDERAWAPGAFGQTTRRFVRISDSLAVLDRDRPKSEVGARGGRFFGGDGNHALYTSTFDGFRSGGIPVGPAAAHIFAVGSATPLLSPNPGDAAAYPDGHTIVLRDRNFRNVLPVGAAFDGQKYLCVVEGSQTVGGPPGLAAGRLGADGVQIDSPTGWTILHDGSALNPAVAGGPSGTFLVVYQVDRGSGFKAEARLVTAP